MQLLMAIYPLIKSTKLFTSYVHNSMVMFIWNIKFFPKYFPILYLACFYLFIYYHGKKKEKFNVCIYMYKPDRMCWSFLTNIHVVKNHCRVIFITFTIFETINTGTLVKLGGHPTLYLYLWFLLPKKVKSRTVEAKLRERIIFIAIIVTCNNVIL